MENVNYKHVAVTAVAILIMLKIVTEEEVKSHMEKGYDALNDFLKEKLKMVELLRANVDSVD